MSKEYSLEVQILSFYNFDENNFRKIFKQIFDGETWAKVFLDDSHHGFAHGNQVRESCLKLVDKLNSEEKAKLFTEGRLIAEDNFYELIIVSIQIAAIFHDCGRFNDNGKIVKSEQKNHHKLSAERVIQFCRYFNLPLNMIKIIEGAVLCHDFQSKILTPNMNSPETIVGKIVQSADQMGWFHPDSLQRTLDYNKALNLPFFDSNETIYDRVKWIPNDHNRDALTVMLSQLFGPTDSERFGVEAARRKVEQYKEELEKGILKIAKTYGVEAEVKNTIEEYRKIKLKLK